MMIWMRLVEGMIRATAGGPPGGEDPANTDLPVHVVSYFFMCWVSVILGGILLIEQYFGRRIHCFQPEFFKQPDRAIGEYCWKHGDFAKNSTETGMIEFVLPDQGWLLQSYVYYFIRAFVFVLPHMMWNTKFRQWVNAIIRGTEDIIKELSTLWLKYEDIADDAFDNYEKFDDKEWQKKPLHERKQLHQQQLQVSYNAVMAMTRDMVNITKQQIPKYSSVLTFLQIRICYDITFMCLFVIFDFVFFITVNKYDSTDFYCILPNSETIRCMVPMMSFQWHAALLGLLSSTLVLLVVIAHAVTLLIATCSSSTSGCLLEHIPFAGTVSDLSWKTSRDRATYKVVSLYLMQNISILHPLNFLEAFIQHMVSYNLVPPDQLKEHDVGVRLSGQHEEEMEMLVKDGRVKPFMRETEAI